MNLAILASGNLGLVCLKHLYDQGHRISIIFTDSKSPDILAYAHANNIPVLNSNPKHGKGVSFINTHLPDIDIIVSINYIFIIESDLIRYPRVAAINFHGSLLPKYRGRTPHVWAIINNETETGITAHYITEVCDAGPIIEQVTISIDPSDSGGSILKKFIELYPPFIDRIIRKFYTGVPKTTEQDNGRATFFGKRTPECGEIKWTWHRERIRNWVRAQSFPYPGAFAFEKSAKVIIDKIEFSDRGYNFEQPDGLILLGGLQPIIKTPNGCVKIIETRNNHNFIEGAILTSTHSS